MISGEKAENTNQTTTESNFRKGQTEWTEVEQNGLQFIGAILRSFLTNKTSHKQDQFKIRENTDQSPIESCSSISDSETNK